MAIRLAESFTLGKLARLSADCRGGPSTRSESDPVGLLRDAHMEFFSLPAYVPLGVEWRRAVAACESDLDGLQRSSSVLERCRAPLCEGVLRQSAVQVELHGVPDVLAAQEHPLSSPVDVDEALLADGVRQDPADVVQYRFESAGPERRWASEEVMQRHHESALELAAWSRSGRRIR